MATLIAMRQRIRAVETIKKITHAMRLISMSSHSRLRHKKVHLELYKNAFQSLWSRLKGAGALPGTAVNTSELVSRQVKHELIILVGSQKGLCGTFNSSLFRFFERDATEQNYDAKKDKPFFVGVGKHAIDYLKNHNKKAFVEYNDFSAAHFVSIAQSIVQLINDNAQLYSQVIVYSNYQKNFFVQRPKKTIVFPLPDPASLSTDLQDTASQQSATSRALHHAGQTDQSTLSGTSEYLFEQSSEELASTVKQFMLTVTLQELLYDSLLAEQAARFLSMDSSTRNADKLLVEMKLEYNKTRQASITRELTELATSIT